MPTELLDYQSPDYYYIDGGNAYWLFGGILFHAPMSASDNLPIWDDAGEVDFSMIDEHLAEYATTVLHALEKLEAATEMMRAKSDLFPVPTPAVPF